jgi:hypothetical protein
MVTEGQMRMNGAATNLQPFESALERLNEGKAADHTATTVYQDSVWPIVDRDGMQTQLIWPDYGGEQIKLMFSTRKVPEAWRARIEESPAWMLLIRLNKTRVMEDVLSRPLAALREAPPNEARVANAAGSIELSDQARLIELLQMLLYLRRICAERPLSIPRLAILLTCWDELGAADRPWDTLHRHLPMFGDFVSSNWRNPVVLGLSALGRALDAKQGDLEYATRGPEQFGFVVREDGTTTPDLTLPIAALIAKND